MLPPVLIPNEICQILIPWLKSHEDDIAHGINDFGDLLPVYEALFDELPQPASRADRQSGAEPTEEVFNPNRIHVGDRVI